MRNCGRRMPPWCTKLLWVLLTFLVLLRATLRVALVLNTWFLATSRSFLSLCSTRLPTFLDVFPSLYSLLSLVNWTNQILLSHHPRCQETCIRNKIGRSGLLKTSLKRYIGVILSIILDNQPPFTKRDILRIVLLRNSMSRSLLSSIVPCF